MNPTQNIIRWSFKIHFNVIIHSVPRFYKCSPPLHFQTKNLYNCFQIRASCSACLAGANFDSNISWWRVRITLQSSLLMYAVVQYFRKVSTNHFTFTYNLCLLLSIVLSLCGFIKFSSISIHLVVLLVNLPLCYALLVIMCYLNLLTDSLSLPSAMLRHANYPCDSNYLLFLLAQLALSYELLVIFYFLNPHIASSYLSSAILYLIFSII
jgi:hypothetical protein